MKSFTRTFATALMLILLGGLAGFAVLAGVAPEMIRPADRALKMHREQNRATLESLSRDVSRMPPLSEK